MRILDFFKRAGTAAHTAPDVAMSKVLYEIRNAQYFDPPPCALELNPDSESCQTREFQEMLKKHLGDDAARIWPRANPIKLQAFLRDWLKSPDLCLARIRENAGTAAGRAWVFEYYGQEAGSA